MFSQYHPFFRREALTPRHLLDQHFGLALTPDDELTVIAIPAPVTQRQSGYYRPWRNLQAAARDTGSSIKEEKGKFQINLDVQHFAPEEISVKTADGFLVIEAKHDERQDEHGFISRSFCRRYALPEGVEADHVVSKLSSDGVLSIVAPLKAPPKVANERVVPIIVQSSPVRKQVDQGNDIKDTEAKNEQG